MTPDRLRGYGGIWLRVAALNVVVSLIVVLTVTSLISENQRHTNTRLARANVKISATNERLSETLALVTDNQNRAACSIRGALQTARSRTKVGKQAATTAADKAKAQAAIDDYTALIDSQRTVPLDFDCTRVLLTP